MAIAAAARDRLADGQPAAEVLIVPSNRLVGLDLLRFFAAFVVMVFHLGFWSWAPENSSTKSILGGAVAYPELTQFAWWGWVGVQIFFVISGFVIAYSASRASERHFARSRFLRLFPGALICATITLGVGLAIDWASPAALLKRYLKTIAFWPWDGWIDGVYWTLGIEIAFYGGVFALLAIRRFAWIEPAMAVVGIGSSIAWLVHFVLVSQTDELGVFGIPSRVLQLLLVHHGMYFAVGVFLWLGMMQRWTRFRLWVFFLCLAGGVLPILAGASRKVAAFDLGQAQWIPIGVWIAAVVAIWASVRFDALLRSAAPRVLAIISTLGLATYPLYLLHDAVGATTLRTLVRAGVPSGAALVLSLSLMVALALVVTVTAERPLRRLLSSAIPTSAPASVGQDNPSLDGHQATPRSLSRVETIE